MSSSICIQVLEIVYLGRIYVYYEIGNLWKFRKLESLDLGSLEMFFDYVILKIICFFNFLVQLFDWVLIILFFFFIILLIVVIYLFILNLNLL